MPFEQGIEHREVLGDNRPPPRLVRLEMRDRGVGRREHRTRRRHVAIVLRVQLIHQIATHGNEAGRRAPRATAEATAAAAAAAAAAAEAPAARVTRQ